MVEITGGVHDGEVLPLVVGDVGLVGGIDDIDEFAALADEEVGDLGEDWFLLAVEELSGVGEIVEGKVAEDELVESAWIIPPGVHGLGGQDDTIEDYTIDHGL